MPDRLVVDLDADGQAKVLSWPDGGRPEQVSQAPLTWPLDADALEDLRWYLEDYLQAPYGVWEERGPAIREKLAGWGDLVFESVFGAGKARDAYLLARDRGLELVFRSADPTLLGLPWELMRDGTGPVAMRAGGISRSLPVAGSAGTLTVPDGKLRVLMVISRPAGTSDVAYQMVVRPLLERLDAVRGEVELTVLRPPTFKRLREVVRHAVDAGKPFHVVHFDGHGAPPGRAGSGSNEGMLAFEIPGGGTNPVGASRIAAVLAAGKVPVVVLNACQSGAIGKELEASVATALLNAGCAAVVAMAYSVYAVAAAEFIAAFYESLFAGESVGQAVTVGRKRLFERNGRPSPRGHMPLADWLVPVHYSRRDVRLPLAHTVRPAVKPSLDEALDQIGATPSAAGATEDPLAAADGVFVGRDDLFYELETAGRLQRVVVLTGPGGTGKTELARGFARWWRNTDGVDDSRLVLWHSFEPGVASFGLDGVISALGLTIFGAEFARLEPPERLVAVKQLLGQHRGLLVWDNFESVREMPDPDRATPPLGEEQAGQLREFLSWVRDHSASTVIITSRAREDWLGDVRRIEVGGLNRAEAAQYAGHLLVPYPTAQQRRDGRSFGELLEWLDGHPLAMRLTLPRLDSTDPAVLLAALRGTTPLPGGDDGQKGRLSSLGACITYSFTHLGEQARRLLPALSLLSGTADAALLLAMSAADGTPERFAGASGEEWTAVLTDAARVGLLTGTGAGPYQIHPALPSYLAAVWYSEDSSGYDRERQEGEQALCTACAVLSNWLDSQIASGNSAPAYTLVGLHRRTFGAMLGRALDHCAWVQAEKIVRVLNEYWRSRGLAGEATAWADRILDTTVGPGQGPTQAARSLWLYITIEQATRQRNAGRADLAEHTCLGALAYLQGQPVTTWTRGSIGIVYAQLGAASEALGQLDEAENWYHQALAVVEEVGDRPAMASVYLQLGNTSRLRGRRDQAEGWCRKALATYQELGDRVNMANSYHQLGVVAQSDQRLDKAEDWYRESLAIREEHGDRPGMAAAYHALGGTAKGRGRLDESEDWYRESLAIREELGISPSLALTYHELGEAAQDRGRLDEAEDWNRKSLAIEEQLGNRSGVARAYLQFGVIALADERRDEAEDWYRKSLAISEELGSLPHMALIYHQLALIAQAGARLDEAEDCSRKSLAIEEQLGDRSGVALSCVQLGLLAEKQGQARSALAWIIRCVTLFDEFPSPLTPTGPVALVWLTLRFGIPALEEAWQQVTGQPVPQEVRDYIITYQNQTPGASA